jgi:hypothetical protein
MRTKLQRDKALYSNKLIWVVYIKYLNNDSTEESVIRNKQDDIVYVVDNSMTKAISKALKHFKKKTKIKRLRVSHYYKLERVQITIRRASKIEIINTRAGIGYKELEVI